MTTITFGTRQETRDSSLDSANRQLFQLIGECILMADNGATCEYLVYKLHELCAKVEAHFAHEEQLMEALDSGQASVHINQHRCMLIWLKNRISNFVENETRIGAVNKILAELVKTYTAHIENEDKKLVLQIRAAAARNMMVQEAA